MRLGIEGKLYRNKGTYAEPQWSEIANVADLTLSLEKGEADVTTRAGGGWRAIKGAIKEASVEFQMIWDAEDEDVQALLAAYLNGTPIEFAVLDGPVNQAGSEGLRATMEVLKFSRGEGKDDAMTVDVALKPTHAPNPPQWMVVQS